MRLLRNHIHSWEQIRVYMEHTVDLTQEAYEISLCLCKLIDINRPSLLKQLREIHGALASRVYCDDNAKVVC